MISDQILFFAALHVFKIVWMIKATVLISNIKGELRPGSVFLSRAPSLVPGVREKRKSAWYTHCLRTGEAKFNAIHVGLHHLIKYS